MNWTEKEDFPKGLDKDCYILAKHSSVMSDFVDEFQVFMYIKNENKLYIRRTDGDVFDTDMTEKFNYSFTHYCEITGIDYLLCHLPMGNRAKGYIQ